MEEWVKIHPFPPSSYEAVLVPLVLLGAPRAGGDPEGSWQESMPPYDAAGALDGRVGWLHMGRKVAWCSNALLRQQGRGRSVAHVGPNGHPSGIMISLGIGVFYDL